MTAEELKTHIGERVSFEDILSVFDISIILSEKSMDYSGIYPSGKLLWVGNDYKDHVDISDSVEIYNNGLEENESFDGE